MLRPIVIVIKINYCFKLKSKQSSCFRLVKTAMMQWNKAYEQRLAALTADDVKRAMNKYLKLENFLIIKAGNMTKVVG